jgi:signal transduction histidine kinase
LRIDDFIRANTERITQEWEAFARSCCQSGERMSTLVLRDEIHEILHAVADNMREPQSSEEQADKGRGRGEESSLDHVGRAHARQRVEIGFRLDEAVSEFRALRSCIVRLWEGTAPEPNAIACGDLTRFNEAIDQVMTESTSTYAAERDRTREQLLAVLGHDLRSPLGAIIMAASVLGSREDHDSERRAQAVDRILRSARRMERLLDDMLDLTRIRLGSGLPLTRASMDLETTCRHVVDELATSHPHRVLRFEPSGDLHGVWDADRLAQVVSNLAGNALHHGDEGAAVVVSARGEGEQVVLAVHNEGRPIPPEDLERIFEPLVQSESRGASAHLGLGLFIVREIVDAHGGRVGVTSSRAEGTTFTVWLPRS